MSTGKQYRNASGGPLPRVGEVQWPRYDVSGAEAQDSNGNLLDGAIIELSEINSVDEIFQNVEFIQYVETGLLREIIYGIEVPISTPKSLNALFYAPIDGEVYGRRYNEPVALRVDANNRQNVKNTNSSIYADGAAGAEDPDGLAGWYFSNQLNEKINWYFFASVDPNAPTFEEFDGCYFVLNIKATGAHTFVNVYTQPQGDGQDHSWYRSRINYDDGGAMDALPVGRYLVHTENLNVDGIFPDLPRITLPYDATFSNGPQVGSERLFLIALSTGSGLAANQNQITVENFAYRSRKNINRFDLLAVTEQQAAASGSFRGEVANDGQLSSVTNPLEGDYAGVQSTGTAWQYQSGSWVDTNNNILFQSWIPPVPPEAPPQNTGTVSISSAYSAKVAQNSATGEIYRIESFNQTYNQAGIASVETISSAGDYFEFPALLINNHTGLGLASTADITGSGPNQNNVADAGILWNYPTDNKSYSGRSNMAYFTGSGPWTYGSQNGGSYTTGTGYNATTLRNLGLFPNYGGGGGATVRVGLDDQYHFYCSVVDGAVNKIVFRSLNPLPVQAYRFVCALYMGNAKLSQLPNRIVGSQQPQNPYSDTKYVLLDGFNEHVSFADSTPISSLLDYSQSWSFGFKVATQWNPENTGGVKYTVLKNGQNTFFINAGTGNASPYLANGQDITQGINTFTGLYEGDRIVVTYNAGTGVFKYHLNGTNTWSRTITLNNNSDGTVTVGQGSGTSPYQSNSLAGGIDEVWFASRPINDAEVQEAVNGGDPALWTFYGDVIDFLLMGEDVFPNIDGIKGQLNGTAENGEAEDFKGY
jgi:hypothetical protein